MKIRSFHIKEKKFKSKADVLSAALVEFSENNFEKSSLNRIIKNAKISKGTFYYHFKNKQEIYLSLLNEGFEKKWQFIRGHMENNPADFKGADIFDKFLLQAKIGVLFAETYPEYHKLSRMLLKEKNTNIYKKAVKHLGNDDNTILSDMIKDSSSKNELDSIYSKEFIEKILNHLFTVFDEVFDCNDDFDTIMGNLESYIRFMKYGLKAKKN